MYQHRRLALSLALALAACGDDASTAPNSGTPRADIADGGAPVFIPAGERINGFAVELGYGWTVLHCLEDGEDSWCLDASARYMVVDGYLCGPIAGVHETMGTLRPISEDCATGPIEQDRWFRLH